MDDEAVSNITQIFTSFTNFVSIVENPKWFRSAKAEAIKNSFKLGLFIEKSLSNFQTKNFLSKFLSVLNEWWKSKNRTRVYNEHFFQFACDQLLIKFFQCENVPESSLEIAIRVYTSIFPRKRLKKVISTVLLISSSQEAVTDFAKINMNQTELQELEYSLLLSNWSYLLQTGRDSEVRKEIENILSLYKIESTLYLLIGILSLNGVTDHEKVILDIILKNLLEKMLDRSLLSKSFWLTMFKKIELCYVCRACENSEEFLESVFNFIVYAGSMMKNEDGVWKSDETACLCPEITYREILSFIKCIFGQSNYLRDFVNRRLNDAQEKTGSLIWVKVKQELFL